VRLGIIRRVQLDQTLDVEACVPKKPKHLSVRKMELDAAIGPIEPVHPSLWTLERL
jgi:hypothetical protein